MSIASDPYPACSQSAELGAQLAAIETRLEIAQQQLEQSTARRKAALLRFSKLQAARVASEAAGDLPA